MMYEKNRIFLLSIFICLVFAPVAGASKHGNLEKCHSRSLGTQTRGSLIGGQPFAKKSNIHYSWNWRNKSFHLPQKFRYANCKTLKKTKMIVQEYRKSNCPALAIGDFSKKGGGFLKGHSSHQNGKDVDLYYPLKNHKKGTTKNVRKIDNKCSYQLSRAIYKSNPKLVLVGEDTMFRLYGKHTKRYPNHNNHFHVRFF